jgi:hypothetical protein
MSIVPATRIGKIEFYESHVAPFSTHSAAIGLSPGSVSALSTATQTARSAYNAHLSAVEASKAATQFFHDKVQAMHSGPGLGSDMIQQIKTFAQTSNNPNVYVLAQIPGPGSPSELPPPGTPYAFKVNLLQTGAIELKWKCDNPTGSSGTIYEVRRKPANAPGGFQFVGTTGERTFVDHSLSVSGGAGGATSFIYQVTAMRTTARGEAANFLVNFGVPATGNGTGDFDVTALPGGPNAGTVRLAA